MKTKWTKKVPKESGWYWVKYNWSKHEGTERGTAICPAILNSYDKGIWNCSTGYGDLFNEGGQMGHSYKTNLKFGNRIEEPDEYRVEDE